MGDLDKILWKFNSINTAWLEGIQDPNVVVVTLNTLERDIWPVNTDASILLEHLRVYVVLSFLSFTLIFWSRSLRVNRVYIELLISKRQNLHDFSKPILILIFLENIQSIYDPWLYRSSNGNLEFFLGRAHYVQISIVIFAANKDKMGATTCDITDNFSFQPT